MISDINKFSRKSSLPQIMIPGRSLIYQPVENPTIHEIRAIEAIKAADILHGRKKSTDILPHINHGQKDSALASSLCSEIEIAMKMNDIKNTSRSKNIDLPYEKYPKLYEMIKENDSLPRMQRRTISNMMQLCAIESNNESNQLLRMIVPSMVNNNNEIEQIETKIKKNIRERRKTFTVYC